MKPSTILRRVWERRYEGFGTEFKCWSSFVDVHLLTSICVPRRVTDLKRETARRLHLDVPRLSPAKAAAVYQFRTARGRSFPAVDIPSEMQPLFVGVTAPMHINDVFPLTLCFIQVDIESLLIRWTHTHFISLHTVKRVKLEARRRSSFAQHI
eukprot:7380391-Prymnesium_polylepis.1